MKQNGVLDKIKGIWVGNYEHESNISLEKIILDTIGDEIKFPIIKSAYKFIFSHKSSSNWYIK